MVIQHNIPALNSHRNLGVNNAKTSKNLEKLSSGYRINRAADDAAGLAISEKMRGQISGLGMAEQNANNGISLIQTAEGGLNETHSILQRMRELAVQSSNGTYQAEDRDQIELEYQDLKSEIDRIASYTNYNGIKLLDGTVGGAELDLAQRPGTPLQGNNAAIATAMGFTADASAVTLATTVATNGTAYTLGTDVAANVLGNVSSNGSGGAAGAASVTLKMTNGAWTVDSTTNTYSNISGNVVKFGDSATNNYQIDVTALNSALGNDIMDGSTVTIGYTNPGDGSAVASTITAMTAYKASDSIPAQTITSGTANVNFTWDSARNSWKVGGGIENAVFGGGKRDFMVDDGTYIEAGSTGTYTLQLTDKISGLSTTIALDLSKFADPDTTAQVNAGTTLADGSSFTLSYALFDAAGAPQATVTPTVSNAYGWREDPTLKPSTKDSDRVLNSFAAMGMSFASNFDLVAGLESSNPTLFKELNGKDAYIITRLSTDPAERDTYRAQNEYETLLQVGDQTFLGELNSATGVMEFKLRNENGSDTTIATLTNAGRATETGAVRFNTGDQNDRNYTSTLVSKEGAQIGSENVSSLVFQIGANGAEDQRIGMYVLNMSSNNIGDHEKGNFVSESTIKTRDDANVAVDTLDKAIVYVASQRAQLGALQNRLEHTLNNLGVTKENLTAAESSIRDVDMAKEMMDFTKNNILVQASQAMLAQANSLPQGVLSLLR